MTVGIAISMVALVLIGFVAWRVMRERPTAVEEAPPVPQRRRPANFALPPETIETNPIDFKKYVPEMVPPIDHKLLAALVASGSRTPAEVPRPQKLARGSISTAFRNASDDASDLGPETLTGHSDLDAAETTRPSSDLDDDALTRTNMAPVR